MSKVICIMGESGSGKTTSLRNLPPSETFFMDCDGKGLPWKGWRKQYSLENKNYAKLYRPETVLKTMEKIETMSSIKYLVIDTLNGIMVGEEIDRMKEKGYDKWQDLAASVYTIVAKANAMRDDLIIILTAHTEVIIEDDGYRFTRVRTNGKKLAKICLESKFNTVLLAKCVNGRYLFETQANNSTAKSPMGAFEEFEIDNDIMNVIKALEEF